VARRQTLRQKRNHPKTPIHLSENDYPRGEGKNIRDKGCQARRQVNSTVLGEVCSSRRGLSSRRCYGGKKLEAD
jgi:hypothetical protein